jgi:hypothetical protein
MWSAPGDQSLQNPTWRSSYRPGSAVREDDSARALMRKKRRKAETGYFTSLVI